MADQNARFLAQLKKLGPHPSGFVAAHFHVSELQPAARSRNNLTRAIGEIAQLKSKSKESEIFLLKNMDIVFLGKDVPRALLNLTCATVEETFVGKAGVTFTNVHGGERQFFTIFDLGSDLDKFLAWAESVAGLAEARAEASGPKKEYDLAQLLRIKEDIQRTDISPMLFNQPVYFIGEPTKVSVLFRECYISMQALEAAFCPGMSLASRPWLFGDLTEDLDAVVLRFLSDPQERISRKRISINLNISTLSSEKFARFDADLPPEHRANIVIEINKTDMIDNMRIFRRLVPKLRERGYRVLLDGMNHDIIDLFDFDMIECDFAKIFWSTDILKLPPERMARLQIKCGRREPPHFMLARCDTADGLRFARTANIHFVQGRLADHMVKKNIPL